MTSTARRTPLQHIDAVVIRPATTLDAGEVERLARLDSQRPPESGRILLAEREGRPVAALVTDGPRAGRVMADPFVPTADLVALLRVRAAETARPARRQVILRRDGTDTGRRPALARG